MFNLMFKLMFLYEVWHAEYENSITFCVSLTVLVKPKKQTNKQKNNNVDN